MKAMIFAAGLGTRLNEETANKPKALVEVNKKPLIHHAIRKLIEADVSKIVVNVHHFAPQVCQYIYDNEKDIPIQISDESKRLLDTGGALKKAAPLLFNNEPVIAYNVDILSDINLQKVVDFHKKKNALATLVVRDRTTSRYLRFNAEQQLIGWINTKTQEERVVKKDTTKITQMAFSGIHILSPQIAQYFPQEDKFSVIDWYLKLAKTQKIIGYFDNSNLWMDVGKPQQLAEARKIFGN